MPVIAHEWWMGPKIILILLLFRGGMVAAQVFFKGSCPNIQPMKGFEPKRFLGRWYEIERFFVSFEGLAGTCWVENYLFEKGRGFFTRLDWKDHLTGKILNIENAITFDKKEPGELHYVVQRPSIPILQGNYRILATDYYTYALAWQCDNLPLGVGHTEILWFLSKNQFPSYETVHTAKHLASNLGLNVNKLEKQNRKQCPP